MRDIELSNGQRVSLQEIIESLEKVPDREELSETVLPLRRDKIKKPTQETIKTAQFDRNQVDWSHNKAKRDHQEDL